MHGALAFLAEFGSGLFARPGLYGAGGSLSGGLRLCLRMLRRAFRSALVKAFLRGFFPQALKVVKTPRLIEEYVGYDIAAIEEDPERLALSLRMPHAQTLLLEASRDIIRDRPDLSR